MSYRTDCTNLHVNPQIDRRLSRRTKVLLVAVLCLMVSVSALAAWQIREAGYPTDLERARAEVVTAYLAEQHANAPWYDSILEVKIKDNRLYVRTDVSAGSGDAAQSSVNATWTRRIYQVLWDWHFEVPELEFDYVYIQNRDGNIIDGGQA